MFKIIVNVTVIQIALPICTILGAYSQNSNVRHHLRASLTVSPSEHLILDSQQNLKQTLTLVTYVLQNQLIPLA